jgi:Ni,Fe-hydrogenase III small subunit/Pyruvate/2-oxoacid:ferredoxin oxidoreductase delta subunit
MFDVLKVRKNQGYQAIPDVRKAEIRAPFRGLPILDEKKCDKCSLCKGICPTEAVSLKPLSIDLGKCIFCGDCEKGCPKNAIRFTVNHKISSTSREFLVVKPDVTEAVYAENAIQAKKKIQKIFGESLKLRQVSAAGCNGCEWELNACGNVNFDMGRFGIDFVPSPRHADGILITGPISENMTKALEVTYQSTPDPKIVILAGSCAISGGVFQDSKALNREFLKKYPIDLYIPGCPVHPLTVINGILDYLGQK